MRSSAMLSVTVVLVTTAFVLASATPAAAAPSAGEAGPRFDVHLVPSEYATIALAFAACSPGDTVRLAPGTYYESGLNLPQGVTLEAANWDPETTIINGGSARGTILSCLTTTDATVQGIGFVGGSSGAGGAVYADNADVTFDYCIFFNNSATFGGAIYWTGGTPYIVGCLFEDNDATTQAGAVYLELTDGEITGCNFNMNEAPWGAGLMMQYLTTTTYVQETRFYANIATAGGGGTFLHNKAAPTYIQCRFDENEAPIGAGAYLSTKTEGSFINTAFEQNAASTYGAGAYCFDEYSLFDGCEFFSNTASSGGGGGICAYMSEAEVMGSVFIENTATYGGALSIETTSDVLIENCTIAKNTSDGTMSGGGVFVYDNSNADVDNSILAFNVSGEGLFCSLYSTATLTCTCVWDNDGGDWVSCIELQGSLSGNMTYNPLFCGLDFFDVYLCADSPCLTDAPVNDCGVLIGAFDEGCVACGSPVEQSSWGAIKALYRLTHGSR